MFAPKKNRIIQHEGSGEYYYGNGNWGNAMDLALRMTFTDAQTFAASCRRGSCNILQVS